jgi:menaquinone-dependent protoporphyrinogen IX oxidase
MGGWKTWAAAILIGACSAARFLGWIDDKMVELIMSLAAALGLIGIGHKIEKAETAR